MWIFSGFVLSFSEREDDNLGPFAEVNKAGQTGCPYLHKTDYFRNRASPRSMSVTTAVPVLIWITSQPVARIRSASCRWLSPLLIVFSFKSDRLF